MIFRLDKRLRLLIVVLLFVIANITGINPLFALVIFIVVGCYVLGPEIMAIMITLLFGPYLGFIGSVTGLNGLGGSAVLVSSVYLLLSKDSLSGLSRVHLSFLWFIGVLVLYNYVFHGILWNEKLTQTLINGLSFSIGLSSLLTVRIEKDIHTAFFALLSAFLVMAVVATVNNFPGPNWGSFASWFRTYSNPFGFNAIVDLDSPILSYHYPGFIALVASYIALRAHSVSDRGVQMILFFAFAVVILSGARQMLLILIVLSFTSFYKRYKVMMIIFVVMIIPVGFWEYRSLIEDFFYATSVNSLVEQSGRLVHFGQGIGYFLENPIVGSGFEFKSYGIGTKWPHNILIEILAEMGLFGLLLIIVYMVYLYIQRPYRNLKTKSSYLIIILVLRSFVSGSISTNIVVLLLPYFIGRNRTRND